MEIKLNEDTIKSVNNYKRWDQQRSHDFVSSYQLNKDIANCVSEILESQKSLNRDSRMKSIFSLSDCCSTIDKLYDRVAKHPTMPMEQKEACINDSMSVIADDLCSRIVVFNRYKGNMDFEPDNSNTLEIMQRIAFGDVNNSTPSFSFDMELGNMFGVTSNYSQFKMDKMQHICSAMSTLMWDMYASANYVDEIRLCGFISDLIFDIEGVFPNVLKDENTDLFWTFIEAVEDVLGFGYTSIHYYIDENDTTSLNMMDALVEKLYQFLRNIILVDRCSDVFGKSFSEFNTIRGQIIHQLGLSVPNFNNTDTNTVVMQNYAELLFNVAVSLINESLEQLWSLYVESNGETDCFTGSICKKITLITLYLMTENLYYLNRIEEVNI